MDDLGSGSTRAALVAALDVVGAAPSERFERIVRVAREVFDVPLSYVNVLDDDLLHTLTRTSRTRSRPGRSAGRSASSPSGRFEPTVITDTTADPRTAGLPG